MKDKKQRPYKHDALRAFACFIDYLHFFDENTTVNGIVAIVDMQHYSMKMELYFTLEERRDFTQTWQVCTNIQS